MAGRDLAVIVSFLGFETCVSAAATESLVSENHRFLYSFTLHFSPRRYDSSLAAFASSFSRCRLLIFTVCFRGEGELGSDILRDGAEVSLRRVHFLVTAIGVETVEAYVLESGDTGSDFCI